MPVYSYMKLGLKVSCKLSLVSYIHIHYIVPLINIIHGRFPEFCLLLYYLRVKKLYFDLSDSIVFLGRPIIFGHRFCTLSISSFKQCGKLAQIGVAYSSLIFEQQVVSHIFLGRFASCKLSRNKFILLAFVAMSCTCDSVYDYLTK